MGTEAASATNSPAFLTHKKAVGCLLGAWLLSVFSQGYIIVPASVLPIITTEFGIPSSTAVWIVSVTPGAWALTNFALGIGIDKFGDVSAIIVSVITVVGASMLSWWAGSHHLFWVLMLARFIAGAGIGIIWTASANVIGQAFTDDTRGTALGLFTTSAPAGFALAQIVTPLVAESYNWAATFVLVAICTLLSLGLFGLSLRNIHLQGRETSGSALQNVGQVLGSRSVRFGCAMAFAAYSLYLFMNSWMPTYLAENFTISLTLSGVLSALFPAVGIVSRASGGYVSDRLLGQRRIPVLRVSFLVALPVTALIAYTTSVRFIAILLVVAGFVIQLTFGIVYSYVQESVDASISGTALSVLGTAGISGAFTAPLIAGALISATGTYVAAFAYAVGIAIFGVGLAWAAPESRF
jgi:nitrate/nitrite transporter NarK